VHACSFASFAPLRENTSTIHITKQPKDDNKNQYGGNASATKLPRSSARQNSS